MAAGLQIWDANGVLVSDTTMRWGRFLGVANIPKPVNTNGIQGTITDAGFLTGEPFYYVYGATGDWIIAPNVTVQGNTLYWDYNFQNIGGTYVSIAGHLSAVTIIYGVR